jgi:hypothetical protein
MGTTVAEPRAPYRRADLGVIGGGLSAASPYFAELRRSGDAAPPGPRVKTFRHWAAEREIRMTSVSLSINGLPECRIVAYTPADEERAEQVAALRRRRQG